MGQTRIEPLLLKDQLQGRYISLDVLRGLTIALMVVVNTPGSWNAVYAPFHHAAWHGFTITDWVFPSFLFVVGNAMSFSLTKMVHQGNPSFLKKVFKRTLLIFVIGLLLTAYPFFRMVDGEVVSFDFSKIRIMGVLQRIAICYAIAALVIFYFRPKGALIYSAVALFGYWAIMYFFGDNSDPYSLTGNAAIKLDLLILGADNMYKGEGIPFDPEGLLSTLPATVNVIAGYCVGRYLQQSGGNARTAVKLVVIGLVLVILAYAWDLVFPINKKIWTSSYVLLTVGLSIWALAFLVYLIEACRLTRWTYFFEVFGRNPLILYALSGLVIKTLFLINVQGKSLNGWFYQDVLLNFLSDKNASLFFALGYMLLIWFIGLVMDKKKIYIRV
jgi:predicted acyltransferase